MSQPVVFDPTSRLIVEQPIQDPNNPSPNSLVLTNEIGVIPPEISNYVDSVIATDPLPAGTWVNIYTVGGVKRARKASAEDTTKTAHGFVAKDFQVNDLALVYFTGPNRNVMSTIPGLTVADIGKPVYLSTTNPGHVQKTLPTAPGQAKQFLGYVTDVGSMRSVVVSKIIDQAGNIPPQAGQAGKVLMTNGSDLGWAPMVNLPTLIGNEGKVLSNNGVTTNWVVLPVPPPVGPAGTVLTSDGSQSQWSVPPGFANPMGGVGDLIVGGTNGIPVRLQRGGYKDVLGVLENGTLGWTPRSIPSPVGQRGKLLSSDDAVTVWVDAPVGLPSQTAHNGKLLTTNGTSASWVQWSLQKAYDQGSIITTTGPLAPVSIKAGTAEEQNLLEGLKSTGDLMWFLTDTGKGYFASVTLGTKMTLQSGASVPRTQTFPDRTGTVALEDETSLKNMLPSMTSQNGKYLTTDGSRVLWTEFTGYTIPSQTGMAGRYLTTNGTVTSWSAISGVLPDMTGNSGKFLTTDGTLASWQSVAGLATPLMTGNNGKFLTTDGTAASWSQVFPTQTGNTGKFLQTDGTNVKWEAVAGGVKEIYSTTEVLTNQEWFGKPVYRTVVDIPNMTKGGSQNINHGIVGITDIADFRLRVKYNGTWFNLGGVDNWASVSATQVSYSIPSSWTGGVVDGQAIIEYTK